VARDTSLKTPWRSKVERVKRHLRAVRAAPHSSAVESTCTSAGTCGTHMTSYRVEMQLYSAHFPHPCATYAPPEARDADTCSTGQSRSWAPALRTGPGVDAHPGTKGAAANSNTEQIAGRTRIASPGAWSVPLRPPRSRHRTAKAIAAPSPHAGKPDRFLRAGGDALSAGLARGHTRRVRRHPAVREALQLREDAQSRKVGVVDATDLEHVVRTDLDAVRLALALRSIDDGRELPRLGATLGGSCHASGMPRRFSSFRPRGRAARWQLSPVWALAGPCALLRVDWRH
jgi:hypothetical protein